MRKSEEAPRLQPQQSVTSDTELIWAAIAGEITVRELALALGQDLDAAKALVAHFGRKRSKFNNQVVHEDDKVFGSQMEQRRYHQLLYIQQAGEISGLETQKAFLLQESFRDEHGKHHRAISYVVDFYYLERDREVAEDTKGHPTAAFRLKEKLFRVRYPHIDLRILYDV